VPFAPAETALATMADRIDGVTPRGKTPITRSLQAAREDLGDRQGDILLISDGIESCDADPCDLVQSWRDAGIDIRVHVVGLGLTDMARGAMQCIADASGTTYFDANSAEDLGEAIEITASSDPPEAGAVQPPPRPTGTEFRLAGQDADGNYLPVTGTLVSADGDSADVSSNGRFVFPAGTYTLTAGIPTLNGVTYEPVTQEVQIEATGRTRIVVTVPALPRVTTRFVENGVDISGPLARAYVNGEEVFGLRPREEHFVLPGTYELRARLNQDNDLRLTETVEAGSDREILFAATKTARVKIVVKPEGGERALRIHQELLETGEVAYKLHYANGGDVRPGTYDIRGDHPLTPYLIERVEISEEENQTIELTVPFGVTQLRYVFTTEAPTSDLRCWLERVDAAGARLARSGALQCDGEALVSGAGPLSCGALGSAWRIRRRRVRCHRPPEPPSSTCGSNRSYVVIGSGTSLERGTDRSPPCHRAQPRCRPHSCRSRPTPRGHVHQDAAAHDARAAIRRRNGTACPEFPSRPRWDARTAERTRLRSDAGRVADPPGY